MPATQPAAHLTYTCASGNQVGIDVDRLGEVTLNFNQDPSKLDQVEANAQIPEAVALVREVTDRMRPGPQPKQEDGE